jgi:hypothetical protein
MTALTYERRQEAAEAAQRAAQEALENALRMVRDTVLNLHKAAPYWWATHVEVKDPKELFEVLASWMPDYVTVRSTADIPARPDVDWAKATQLVWEERGHA